MTTKAVRFNEKEDRAIKEFLEQNPYFDFSTLARIAILRFVERPDLKLIPIKSKNDDNKDIE